MAFAERLATIAGAIAGAAIEPLDADRALPSLGERLALANLGLVRVHDPERFSWPGHWIAVVETAAGDRMPVLMFGVPSGPLEAEGIAALDGGTVVEGYLITPLDLGRPHGAAAYAGALAEGAVAAIFTAPTAGAPCVSHEARRALAGRGLEGDRYAEGDGTFSADRRGGQALTLVAAEALAHARENGAQLPDDAAARRNVVTTGVVLESLIGHRFAIGTAICRATRLAEPCAHLQRLTAPGVLRAMVHLGGIRADVLETGEIRVGDVVHALPD